MVVYDMGGLARYYGASAQEIAKLGQDSLAISQLSVQPTAVPLSKASAQPTASSLSRHSRNQQQLLYQVIRAANSSQMLVQLLVPQATPIILNPSTSYSMIIPNCCNVHTLTVNRFRTAKTMLAILRLPRRLHSGRRVLYLIVGFSSAVIICLLFRSTWRDLFELGRSSRTSFSDWIARGNDHQTSQGRDQPFCRMCNESSRAKCHPRSIL